MNAFARAQGAAESTEAILLSCGVELSRNFSGRRFWASLDPLAREDFYAELDAFRVRCFPGLLPVYDASGSQHSVEVGVERLDLPEAFRSASSAPWTAFQEPDGRRGLLLGGGDHLRIWARRPGCDLLPCLEELSDWEEMLRRELPLACDLHWGWLTEDPGRLGTGMDAEVRIFAPALRWSRRLTQVGEGLDALGFALSPALGEEDSSLLRLSNRMALGVDEAELAARLEALALRVREEERRALEELVQEGEAGLRDAALRSDAVLGSCSLLSRAESLRRFELCAMGSRLGWLPEDRAALAARLQLATGRACLEEMAGPVASEAHPDLDDLRAGAVVKAWKAGG